MKETKKHVHPRDRIKYLGEGKFTCLDCGSVFNQAEYDSLKTPMYGFWDADNPMWKKKVLNTMFSYSDLLALIVGTIISIPIIYLLNF